MSTAAAGPNATAEEPIVVYQSADREGSTFALSTATRRSLEHLFGAQLRLSPRIFIAHGTRDDYQRLHADLANQILILLTGLTPERLAQLGPVEFRDPVTQERL